MVRRKVKQTISGKVLWAGSSTMTWNDNDLRQAGVTTVRLWVRDCFLSTLPLLSPCHRILATILIPMERLRFVGHVDLAKFMAMTRHCLALRNVVSGKVNAVIYRDRPEFMAARCYSLR